MSVLKKNVTTKSRRSAARAPAPAAEKTEPTLVVAVRQQTHDEERRFNTAIDLFLAEWVRQQLRSRGEQLCTKI